MVKLFEDSMLCAIHAKRVTLSKYLLLSEIFPFLLYFYLYRPHMHV